MKEGNHDTKDHRPLRGHHGHLGTNQGNLFPGNDNGTHNWDHINIDKENHLKEEIIMLRRSNVFMEFVSKADDYDRITINWKGYEVGFRFLIDKDGDGVRSVVITTDLAREMNLSEVELYELARENTPRLFPIKFGGMTEILFGFEDPDEKMFVLTNESGFKGAVAILYPDAMETIKAKIPGHFYMIPSSVHEWILLPDNGDMTPDEINGIIDQVNSDVVDPSDQLGDEVLYF